jgi:hypothetical protein
MFEHPPKPLPPRPAFLRRVARSVGVSTTLLGISLGIGVVGYHAIAGLDWIDAILNASMILTGMGPVSPLRGAGAKLFASGYALFSGVVFVASAGLVVAPLAHRFLHRFHVELEGDPGSSGAESTGRSPRAKPTNLKT